MYARVAFPSALPEALSYSLSEEQRLLARPGVRALAPLRGRPRVGLIVEVSERADCPEDRVLPLGEVLDPEPLLPAHILDLVLFAASYYAAPVGTVVRAAVPGQLLRLPPPLVELGPQAFAVRPPEGSGERRLLDRLRQAHRIGVARLLLEGWEREGLNEALKGLEECRAVRVVQRQPKRHGGVTVTAVTLTDLSPGERRLRVAGAPAQERVLAFLEERQGPVLESELRTMCGCSAGVTREMVRKGLARRFPQAKSTAPRRWELESPAEPVELTAEQGAAVTGIQEAIAAGTFRATLLHGVTGSGKTEVYLRLAMAAVSRGRQALILVPEIALTPALAGQLSGRFGDRVAMLHSSIAEGERFQVWERVRRGLLDVVAGARSALWAPLPAPGLVVVDEEQDTSYKQDEEPRYHARDLALVMGQRLSIPVVLASATPSMESVWLARRGKLSLARLHSRVGGGTMPAVELVDLKGERPDPGEHGRCMISGVLRERLLAVVGRGEQAIVLVNRRGWAPILLCRECGQVATCSQCSVNLTVHRRSASLVCHYCGAQRALPSRCPGCGGELLEDVGAGTEKVAARLRDLLPSAGIEILDRDTARSPARLVATLTRFAAGESQLLVGTQMVSKGHHFPGVTLTAVVSADNLVGFADFRASEWTFQMLIQAAGRAGRGERPGSVVIQTYNPDNHAIRAALDHDTDLFIEEELRYRMAFGYPPCARMALLRYESASEAAALDAARKAASSADPLPQGVRVIGPSPAPLARLRGKWRVQTILLAPTRGPLREALARVVAEPLSRQVRRVVDVDPQSTV